MQEKGFYLPLTRSRYIVIYSFLLHILAVLSVSLLAVSMIVKILLVTVVLISHALHIYRLGFIGKYSKRPVALRTSNQEYWQISYADNSLAPNLVLESAWVTRLAVIIFFKPPDKRSLSILVVKDAVDKEQFRQLRVRIRLAFFRQ